METGTAPVGRADGTRTRMRKTSSDFKSDANLPIAPLPDIKTAGNSLLIYFLFASGPVSLPAQCLEQYGPRT